MVKKAARMLIRWAATVWAEVQEEIATGRTEAAWNKANVPTITLANQHALNAWEEVRKAAKEWAFAGGVAEANAAKVRQEAWAVTAEAWDLVSKAAPGKEEETKVANAWQLENRAIELARSDGER